MFAGLLAWSPAARAGGTSVKGAMILFVQDSGAIDVNDRWWVAVGHDWSAGSTAFVGFELSSAFRRDVIGGKLDSRIVPVNAFVQVRLKARSDDVRPYVGGGLGLASALVWTSVSAFPRSFSTFDYETALGYQAFGGVELRRRFTVEAVFQRTFATVGKVATSFEPAPEHSLSLAVGVGW